MLVNVGYCWIELAPVLQRCEYYSVEASLDRFYMDVKNSINKNIGAFKPPGGLINGAEVRIQLR